MDRTESIILRGLLYSEAYMRRVLPFIEPQYFLDKTEKTIFGKVESFVNEYNTVPSKEALIIEINDTPGVQQDELEAIVEYLNSLEAERDEQPHIDWLVEKTEEWCQEKAIHNAVLEVINILDSRGKSKTPKGMIPKLLQDALAVSFDPHVGHDYIEDADMRYDFYHRVDSRIPFHLAYFNKITKNGVPNKTLNICLAGTGCHGWNEPILRSDGSVTPAQEIRVGDSLIGPDGTPRKVTALHSGTDQMYEITVATTKDRFIVNGGHILSLVHTTKDTVVNVSISDYLTRGRQFKALHKLYYCGQPIEFTDNQFTKLTIPPYIMGVLLGDGHTHSIGVTTADKEIVDAVMEFAEQWSASVRVVNNGSAASTYFLSHIESYGLGQNFNVIAEELSWRYGLTFKQGTKRTTCSEKFIPDAYKRASVEARLHLLAGLIDTDGCRANTGYEYCSKSKQLVHDVTFIARSLGFVAHCTTKYINQIPYYRAHLTPTKFSLKVPTRIPRKTPNIGKPRKDRRRSSFTVKPIGIARYYGFEVDGDHLYLLGNYLVTHNSGKSLFMCDLASHYLMLGKRVLYVTLEMAQERIAERIDANLMNRSLDELGFMTKEAFERHIQKIRERTKGALIVKEYATAQAHVGHFRHLLNELNLKKQFIPDVIFVDYLNICASSRLNPNTGLYELVKSIAEELRGLAVEFNVPVWSATQMNRAGFASSDPDLTNTSESFGLPAVCDFLFAMINTGDLINLNQVLIKILKNRYGDVNMKNKETGHSMNKFAVGIDREKQRLYNLEDSAQKDISQDDDSRPKVPPEERSFNKADEEAERRRANEKAVVDPYRPNSRNVFSGNRKALNV